MNEGWRLGGKMNGRRERGRDAKEQVRDGVRIYLLNYIYMN